MRVYWTNTALEHLVLIYEHIAQDSPQYAQRMIDRLVRRSEQIATFPLPKRMVPEYEAQAIRELVERPHRIIYRVKADQVDVLAVVHGTQSLPPDL